MMNKFYPILLLAIIASCVPARKYEEVADKQKSCAEELESLKLLKNSIGRNSKNNAEKKVIIVQNKDWPDQVVKLLVPFIVEINK